MMKRVYHSLLPMLAMAMPLLPLQAQDAPASAEAEAALIPYAEFPYKLNVVYFLGSDREPIEGYEQRLSDLLLLGQEFYGLEMLRNGFGLRSFPLEQSSPEKVNILIYRAPKPASEYPYSQGGGSRAAAEVNAWLDAEEGRRKSQHTLIIFPTWYDEQYNDLNPGGVPFYGLGRTCCALDYKNFDIQHLGKDTPEGRLMTKWFGGMLHELGHGLNMPHNHASATETATLGTALMGAGNYTYGLKPTFMTKASCAILDVCELFACEAGQAFYTDKAKNLKIKDIKINFAEDVITLSADYQSNEVKSVICYVEDAPTGANLNYEAANFTEAFPRRDVDKDEPRVSFTMPWAEMPQLSKEDCLIRVRFLMTDGSYKEEQIEFKRSQRGEVSIKKTKMSK